jgi:plastocyanin
MQRPILPALAIAAALAFAACGGGTTPAPSQGAPSAASSAAPSAAPSAAAGGQNVEIKNFAFNPASATAKVGDKVTWKNSDSATHTVTFDDGSTDSNDIATGATFEHIFDKAGTFAYHCKIHSSMKGTITVS